MDEATADRDMFNTTIDYPFTEQEMNADKNPFVMQQFAGSLKGFESAGGSEFVNCHDLAREVFGDKADDGNLALAGMAYLWRRFGPPIWGTDARKSIVNWMVTTPEPDVHLNVDPCPCGLAYSFRYVVKREAWYPLSGSPEEHKKWEDDFWQWFLKQNPHFEADKEDRTKKARKLYSEWRWKTEKIREAEKAIGKFPASKSKGHYNKHWSKRPDPIPRVNGALVAAMYELCRPVYVRDSLINIVGRTDDGVFTGCLAKFDGRDCAEPSKYAGLGVPIEAMDKLLNSEK